MSLIKEKNIRGFTGCSFVGIKKRKEEKNDGSSTHRLQVVLHDVPRGLHHLEHHVVLDVLHKVEHPLPEGERGGEPAERAQCEDTMVSLWLMLGN